MPVEIKELIVRATIVESNPTHSLSPRGAGAQETDAIVTACVEQVLKILERKKER
ncbi:DUF5908 family protein [Coleofasciculus sp. F4-SAH-05]|uniref:DUF5908 family protein n=1 Tax=Coleofasciculus sp. F4-SAH-05 TaxID=3069525 RepID=UPI0032F1FB1B